MPEPGDFQIVAAPQPLAKREPAVPDPGATPFKIVVDPEMRAKLRRALFELIDYHDEALAEHFAQGKLELESYKEYIELFARSLKETMDSRAGVAYLLRAAGFEVPLHEINLHPELRWKRGAPGAFGASLL
ncbi:MAG TPA: hypothetical protein VG095_09790 [Chthoniobacterales bacterium]|nr:hypothetical protein [Chthoniobacterales bacterium]